MTRILHIEASPRKKRSVSRHLAENFLADAARLHPDLQVETLDIWSFPLPEYDESTADAKFHIMHGQPFSAEEQIRWHKIEQIFQHFANHDLFLFSVPMWNFGIPYRLKHYIDLITQPKLAFDVGPQGYRGLLTGRRAVVIYASGGDYRQPPASGFDFQSKYLEFWLNFIGVTDISAVSAAPLLAGDDLRKEATDRAEAQLRALAEKL